MLWPSVLTSLTVCVTVLCERLLEFPAGPLLSCDSVGPVPSLLPGAADRALLLRDAGEELAWRAGRVRDSS